jgi:1,2-phenylacetyl-CoA epoxidase catalytic subunit
MLIPAEALRFDFGGAQFDLSGAGDASARDRRLLGWVLNQFLYGEVTGIQCGHWLYRAPHLGAATFLAKQASEELSHVRKILRILTLLGERPAEAHPAVKFLSTGMMGGSWGEHVAMEMALGEGLVLAVFYALVDTTQGHPEIHRILTSAASEEERHVEFGERETRAWLQAHPADRRRLLALALVQTVAMRVLKRFVVRKLRSEVGHQPRRCITAVRD